MCRSHFQTSCTEFDIYIIILNHWDDTAYQRNNNLLTFQVLIFRVIRIDTHSGIAHNRLRTSSRNNGITVFTLYLISQIIQLSMLLFVNHLLVRQSCQCLRVPVYHTHATVNKSLLVKVYKYFQHTFATLFVHSKSSTVPVTGCPQLTELFQDNPTMFICPCPSMLQKLVTSQISLFNTLCSQLIHHLCFGSDRGMVGSRHPTSILAFHTCTTNEDILNGIIKHVSHMQHTGDVRGRNNDGVRFTSIGFRTE